MINLRYKVRRDQLKLRLDLIQWNKWSQRFINVWYLAIFISISHDIEKRIKPRDCKQCNPSTYLGLEQTQTFVRRCCVSDFQMIHSFYQFDHAKCMPQQKIGKKKNHQFRLFGFRPLSKPQILIKTVVTIKEINHVSILTTVTSTTSPEFVNLKTTIIILQFDQKIHVYSASRYS